MFYLPERVLPKARRDKPVSKKKRRKERSVIPYYKAQNLYETLGIAQTTPQPDIAQIRRRLLFRAHPDKHKSPLAARIYACLESAFDIIKDPVRRKTYDFLLKSRELPVHGMIDTDFSLINGKIDFLAGFLPPQ